MITARLIKLFELGEMEERLGRGGVRVKRRSVVRLVGRRRETEILSRCEGCELVWYCDKASSITWSGRGKLTVYRIVKC